MRINKTLFFLLLFFLPLSLCHAGEYAPRGVLAFWDSRGGQTVDDCLVHRTLEMPLNYLGLDVMYWDIQQPLPDIASIKDICGVIICFNRGTQMKDPVAFIDWTIDAMDHGKKVVIMENPGFLSNFQGKYTDGDEQNRLYQKIGFITTQEWIDYPFNYRVLSADQTLIPFELKLPSPLPGFYINRITNADTKSFLSLAVPGDSDSQTDLLIISPRGAYVVQYYSNTFDILAFSQNPRSLGWYFNPFRFFELVFGLEGRPVPDPTTLAGRRIFFSTCHGDGWSYHTNIEGYERKDVWCAEIILDRVVKPNPDIPVAIAVIAAEVDPAWGAKAKSQEIAREYFKLPQVEAASHTYSHPFYWDFFRTGGPEKEMNYLYLYPFGSWQNSLLSWLHAKRDQFFYSEQFKKEKLKWGYALPRAFATEPFSLEKEITGAVAYLNRFAPANNPANLLFWSGDSRPWSTAFEIAEKAGIKQHGGGFVRFDSDYPSNLFVYPFGRKPGGHIQLYVGANADNGYTHEWSDNFYGFKFLPSTLKNTDSPRRLKPIQLYFHSYSGQFQASVDALLSNIAYIREQATIPIRAARYCEIGEGFYTTDLEPLGEGKWRILNRKGLQTVRFDDGKNLQVDLASSMGVVGWRVHNDSLYVYLDAALDEAVVAVIPGATRDSGSHLIDSSWEVWNLKREGRAISFLTRGWGKLSMTWKMSAPGHYEVSVPSQPLRSFATDDEGFLAIEWDLPYNTELSIEIK